MKFGAPGLYPSIPNFLRGKNIGYVAEANQQHCLEESEQWLESVDRTHLLLARGKLAPLKRMDTLKLISFIFYQVDAAKF